MAREPLDLVSIAPHFGLHAIEVELRRYEQVAALLAFGQDDAADAGEVQAELADLIVPHEPNQARFHFRGRWIRYRFQALAGNSRPGGVGHRCVLLDREVRVVLILAEPDHRVVEAELLAMCDRFVSAPDAAEEGKDCFPPVIPAEVLDSRDLDEGNGSGRFGCDVDVGHDCLLLTLSASVSESRCQVPSDSRCIREDGIYTTL